MNYKMKSMKQEKIFIEKLRRVQYFLLRTPLDSVSSLVLVPRRLTRENRYENIQKMIYHNNFSKLS